VTASAATSVTASTATLNGNVTSAGGSDSGATITDRGFVYGTSSSLTINSNKTAVSGTTGSFTANITGLAGGTAYFFQAYASNAVGLTFSSPALSFSTTGTTPPTLTSTNSSVDGSFNITFADSAAWRANLTGITVGGVTLSTSAYSVSAGKIAFTPANDAADSLIRTPGSKTIVINSTTFSAASTSLTLLVGADNKLTITTQPTSPIMNGGTLATQPVVAIQDQYGNATTSTANIVANVGSGTWTIGGTTTKAGLSGTATFTDLIATSAAAVTGATISFSASGVPNGVTSGTFNLLQPTITAWTFENDSSTTATNSPAPSTGTGTADSIGMNLNGTAGCDVLAGVSGDTGVNGIANLTELWRIRSTTGGNGWTNTAGIGTQGAQFAASTAGYNSITVSFDWYTTTRGEANAQLQYTTDGSNWNNVPLSLGASYTGIAVLVNSSSANTVMGTYAHATAQGWFTNLTATISDAAAANNPNFAIRVVNASTGADCVDTAGTALNNTSGNWRFDNIIISGNAAPGISSSGALSAVNTTYGTASATPTSFTVSGVNMSAGITVTPPAGFELSQTAGGASGYAGSGSAITVGSSGTITSITVYVRLAATATVGSSPYSGNIICSSSGATSVNVATVSSTVNKKALTVTGASVTSRPYDGGTAVAMTGATLNGVVNSDPITLGSATSGTFASANVANNIAVSTSMTISGTGSGNYTLTQPSLTGNITKATATVVVTPYSVTYNGAAHTATVTSITGVNSETGAAVGSVALTTTHTLAGTYSSDSWSFTGIGNYNSIGSTPITDTINQATPSVTVTVGSYIYSGSSQGPNSVTTASSGSVTYSYVGTGGTTYSSSSTAPTGAGTYNVTATVAADANYNAASSSATAFTIGAKAASVTADAKTKTYGDVNPALTAVTNGAVNGDVINITLGTTATQYSSVGVSNITVTLGSNPNYTVSATNSTLTINPAGTFIGASSSANPSGYKAGVSFTATLPIDATGSVVFSSPGGPFSTNPVAGASTTSLSLGNLLRGTNLITVAYAGNGNYLGSTNTLNQIVTNHPPVALANNYSRSNLSGWKIAISDLLTNASDVIDGDTLTLAGVGTSTNLVTLDTTSLPGYVAYYNANPVADQFTYTVTDGFGGTNTATITLSYASTHPVTGTSSIAGITGTNPKVLTAYGIPNYSYITQRSTNLIDWVDIVTNAAATNGAITISDYFGDLGSNAPGSAYYRLKGQ